MVEKQLTVCVVALNGKFVRPPVAAIKKDAVHKKRRLFPFAAKLRMALLNLRETIITYLLLLLLLVFVFTTISSYLLNWRWAGNQRSFMAVAQVLEDGKGGAVAARRILPP